MLSADYHVHTRFCDGEGMPEEFVREALEKGLSALGFSGHSHTPMDESWCMSREATALYQAEIRHLKEKYRGQIEILLGIEQDYFSDMPTADYDYVIGSVHYIRLGESFVPVDELPELTWAPGLALTGGNPYALTAAYFEHVSRLPEVTHCDIIGHFDLISKYNAQFHIFDENDPRYIKAWKKAADTLLLSGCLFEINTSPLTRGLRTEPHPSRAMLEYLKERGAHFILSSDTHMPGTLCAGFEKFRAFSPVLRPLSHSFL